MNPACSLRDAVGDSSGRFGQHPRLTGRQRAVLELLARTPGGRLWAPARSDNRLQIPATTVKALVRRGLLAVTTAPKRHADAAPGPWWRITARGLDALADLVDVPRGRPALDARAPGGDLSTWRASRAVGGRRVDAPDANLPDVRRHRQDALGPSRPAPALPLLEEAEVLVEGGSARFGRCAGPRPTR